MNQEEKGHINKLKEIVWNHQGITSYGLMAEYIKSGYEYKHNNSESFDNLVRLLKHDENTIYNEEKDTFKVYKQYNIVAMLESRQIRRNCYNCLFCHEVRSYTDANPEKYICALNPTLEVVLSMDHITDKCPINVMLNSMKKDDNTEK